MFKVLYTVQHRQNSIQLGTKHPWVKGIQVCSENDHILFQAEIITKERK